ncbi:MAG: hypothetical protein ACO3FE_22465 [Planctomycetaceae bacterium]
MRAYGVRVFGYWQTTGAGDGRHLADAHVGGLVVAVFRDFGTEGGCKEFTASLRRIIAKSFEEIFGGEQ